MRPIRVILSVIFILIVSLIVIGCFLPSKWKVERSIVIDKPSKMIYPFVADFRKGWPQWCAFDMEDPAIRYTYSGPAQGEGAARSWISKKMGNGSQKIFAADKTSGVIFELRMAGNNFVLKGRIAFVPAGKFTRVTWTDSGDVGRNLFLRYMVTLMDRMMGPAFERSLANLKARSEAPTRMRH